MLAQEFLAVYRPIVAAGGNSADVANALNSKLTPHGVAKFANICRRQYQDELAEMLRRKTVIRTPEQYAERLAEIANIVPMLPIDPVETAIKSEHKECFFDLLDGLLD